MIAKVVFSMNKKVSKVGRWDIGSRCKQIFFKQKLGEPFLARLNPKRGARWCARLDLEGKACCHAVMHFL
jgi:hypothetical protein